MDKLSDHDELQEKLFDILNVIIEGGNGSPDMCGEGSLDIFSCLF